MLIYKKFFGQLGNTADTGIFWVSPLPKGKNWVNGWPWKGITTLDLEQFLRGVRTPARPTPKEWLCIAVVQLHFRINREALPILFYLLYWSSKPLRTEKAGSKGTGMASKVARQE